MSIWHSQRHTHGNMRTYIVAQTRSAQTIEPLVIHCFTLSNSVFTPLKSMFCQLQSHLKQCKNATVYDCTQRRQISLTAVLLGNSLGHFQRCSTNGAYIFFYHILSSRFVHIHVQTERVCASISGLCFPPNLYSTVHFWGPENRKMHIALKTGVQVLVTSGCQIGDCNQQQTYSQHHFNRKTQRPSGIWLVQTWQYPMKTSCFLCMYEGLILEY